jgi:hypothetical protein
MARPEVTGRKTGGKKTKDDEVKAAVEQDAYSIKLFCQRHCISIAHFYRYRDSMPRTIYSGAKVLITKDDAERWRRHLEDRARPPQQAVEPAPKKQRSKQKHAETGHVET